MRGAGGAAAATAPPTAEFFVDAVHGDDRASGGSPSTAFATLRRAQSAVRQVPRGAAGAFDDAVTPLATVSLRSAGIHWVHRAVNATAEALQSTAARGPRLVPYSYQFVEFTEYY